MIKSVKKTIWMTALYTIVSLLILLSLTTLIMTFVFTRTFADFFYSLGANSISSSLYYREYQKSSNIFYCYKSLNLEIKLGNNKKIIKYYDTFVDDEEYDDFMIELIDKNEKNIGRFT